MGSRTSGPRLRGLFSTIFLALGLILVVAPGLVFGQGSGEGRSQGRTVCSERFPDPPGVFENDAGADRVGIIIAVGEFDDPDIRDLELSVKGGLDVFGHLADPKLGNFKRLYLLTDRAGLDRLTTNEELADYRPPLPMEQVRSYAIEPTRENVLDVLCHVSQTTMKSDDVLVYVISHGGFRPGGLRSHAIEPGKMILLLRDTEIVATQEETHYPKNALTQKMVIEALGESVARRKALIEATCHGPLSTVERYGASLARLDAGRSLVVVTTSAPGSDTEATWAKQLETYTYHWLRALELGLSGRDRWKIDLDRSGTLSLEEAHIYAAFQTFSDTEGAQRPTRQDFRVMDPGPMDIGGPQYNGPARSALLVLSPEGADGQAHPHETRPIPELPGGGGARDEKRAESLGLSSPPPPSPGSEPGGEVAPNSGCRQTWRLPPGEIDEATLARGHWGSVSVDGGIPELLLLPATSRALAPGLHRITLWDTDCEVLANARILVRSGQSLRTVDILRREGERQGLELSLGPSGWVGPDGPWQGGALHLGLTHGLTTPARGRWALEMGAELKIASDRGCWPPEEGDLICGPHTFNWMSALNATIQYRRLVGEGIPTAFGVSLLGGPLYLSYYQPAPTGLDDDLIIAKAIWGWGPKVFIERNAFGRVWLRASAAAQLYLTDLQGTSRGGPELLAEGRGSVIWRF